MESTRLTSALTEYFDPIAADAGFVEIHRRRNGVLESVYYASDLRMITFSLERREGDLTAYYGPRHYLDETRDEYVIESNARSLEYELRMEGILIPNGNNLYAEGELERAVKILVKGIQDRSEKILGVKL